MAVPTTATPGSNSAQAGAGVINMPLTAPILGARAFVVVAHRDNAVGTPTPSATAGFGTWEQVSGSPVVEGTARLTVWTAIVESTAPTQITISDSGDHQQIRVFYVSHANGTPDIHATLASTDAVSDAGGDVPCPTTTVNDCVIYLFAAGNTPDANTTTEYTTPVNAGLTSIVEMADNATQQGLGSSKLLARGEKLTAGTISNWTYTKTNAGLKAHLVVAVAPPTPLAPTYETSIDNFDRADDLLDAGAGAAIWTRGMIASGAASNISIVSNRAAATSGTFQSAFTKTKIEGANCDVIAEITTIPTGELGLWALLTDAGTANYDAYTVFWVASGTNWILRRYANGVNMGNLDTSVAALAAGDTIWFRKRGSDLRVYKKISGGNYMQVLSAIDTNLNPAEAVIGVEISDTTQRWDNLRGGPIVTAAPSTTQVAMVI